MSNLQADYVKEREGIETVGFPGTAFATYKIEGSDCYLKDIYVIPEKRRGHLAYELADMVTSIARKRGCRRLLGSVSPSAKGSTESLKFVLNYDMKLLTSDKGIIYFEKEIKWQTVS